MTHPPGERWSGNRYDGPVETLQAKVARLQRERDEAQEWRQHWLERKQAERDRAEAAEAQLAEMRKILEARGEYVVRLEAQRNAANQELMHTIERTTAGQEGLVKQLAEMRAAISPEERAALRERHQRTKGCDEPHCVECYKVWCGVCFEDFPCPTARVLDALEAAEQRVAALEELRDWTPGRRTTYGDVHAST